MLNPMHALRYPRRTPRNAAAPRFTDANDPETIVHLRNLLEGMENTSDIIARELKSRAHLFRAPENADEADPFAQMRGQIIAVSDRFNNFASNLSLYNGKDVLERMADGTSDIVGSAAYLGIAAHTLRTMPNFFARAGGWENLLDTTHGELTQLQEAGHLDTDTAQKMLGAVTRIKEEFARVEAERDFFMQRYGDLPTPSRENFRVLRGRTHDGGTGAAL